MAYFDLFYEMLCNIIQMYIVLYIDCGLYGFHGILYYNMFMKLHCIWHFMKETISFVFKYHVVDPWTHIMDQLPNMEKCDLLSEMTLYS